MHFFARRKGLRDWETWDGVTKVQFQKYRRHRFTRFFPSAFVSGFFEAQIKCARICRGSCRQKGKQRRKEEWPQNTETDSSSLSWKDIIAVCVSSNVASSSVHEWTRVVVVWSTTAAERGRCVWCYCPHDWRIWRFKKWQWRADSPADLLITALSTLFIKWKKK